MEMILKLLKMIIKKKKIENENQKKIVLIHIILANLQLYVFDYVENILFIIFIDFLFDIKKFLLKKKNIVF